MSMKFEFFNDARIELGKECILHPELKEPLAQVAADDFIEKLAEIAAYVNQPVEGVFTPEEIDNLCRTLIWQLRKKRLGQIAVINSTKNH